MNLLVILDVQINRDHVDGLGNDAVIVGVKLFRRLFHEHQNGLAAVVLDVVH